MRMLKITSPLNPRVRNAAAIRHRRVRSEGELFLAEGVHPVIAALDSGAEIEEVFVTGDFCATTEGRMILKRLAGKKAGVVETTPEIIKKISDSETPQGISAVVRGRYIPLADLHAGPDFLAVTADRIQDPGNLGALIRTADASGAAAVVLLQGTCDPFSPKAVRATAGSIFNISLCRATEDELVAWLRSEKIRLAVAAVRGAEPLFDADLSGPLTMVFGNEGGGASERLLHEADLLLGIPIYGKAESLNVTAAAAIFLYEAARRRMPARTVSS